MGAKRKILAIDDEKTNLEIIGGFLRIGGFDDYEVISCDNATDGFKCLIEYADQIDVILLDRMMPGMSGVDFINKVNEDKILKRIPIIMQTASQEQAHMVEGFKLGVYHYLVKPYLPTVFNSVVRSAIDFYRTRNKLYSDLSKTKILYQCVNQATFKIKSLNEASEISVGLAQLFPEPAKVVLGISEILVNAIEHGNLQISYEEKSKLNVECRWREEVEKRSNLPEFKDKCVTITYSKRDDQIVLNVKDEGEGFDYSDYLEFATHRSTDNHGRGIAFANSLSFDRLEYVGKGNEVNCIIRLH